MCNQKEKKYSGDQGGTNLTAHTNCKNKKFYFGKPYLKVYLNAYHLFFSISSFSFFQKVCSNTMSNQKDTSREKQHCTADLKTFTQHYQLNACLEKISS